jgi:signal peptidase I
VLLRKSFAAEAFVIPTGSMAETLWGYQKVVTCPSCGYQFPVNCADEVDPQENRAPQRITGCTCPNCRQKIYLRSPQDDPPGVLPPDVASISDPGWSSGDRVLVAKFIYDLFNRLPDRLDVVVFKFPGNADFPASGPHKNHVPLNYIKRLIGLPGETIAIYGGKIYILSPATAAAQGLQYPDCYRLRYPDDQNKDGDRPLNAEENKQRALELWQKRFMTFPDERKVRELFENGHFVILRRPPEVLLAMRRIVFDNNHLPNDADGKALKRWSEEGKGWKVDGSAFTFEAGGEGTLTYRHILRGSEGKPQLITDAMGYNTDKTGQMPFGSDSRLGQNWVGDLMLECDLVVNKSEGEVALELNKGEDHFQAVFDLTDGFCTLKRGDKVLAKKETSVKGPGTYSLRFCDFDDKLTLWINGSPRTFGRDGVTYDGLPKENRGPRKKDLDEPAQIRVKGAGVTVRGLRLWRDTYYTHNDRNGINYDSFPPEEWARQAAEEKPETIYVQPGHFLCLGDNSPKSSDGRSWGLVPDRLLLGRAVLVYYPFYCPVWPLSSQVNRVGMIK